MKHVKILFTLCLMFIAFDSCQKDGITPAFDEVLLSQQETQAEETLNDLDILVDDAINLNFGFLKSGTIVNSFYLGDCPVVTVNKTDNPQVMTIDFGTSCTGRDGKKRSGKIVVTCTAFNTFPSVRDKSFENYFVDGKKIEGKITKTISKDQVNNIRTAVLTENVTITFPNGEGTAKRVANLTRQYQMNNLANKEDNQVVSWGSVEFTKVSGVKVSKAISDKTPLVFKASCHHIVSGIVSFSNSNDRKWSIDYGNGECDNKAVLTKGDITKEIKIP